MSTEIIPTAQHPAEHSILSAMAHIADAVVTMAHKNAYLAARLAATNHSLLGLLDEVQHLPKVPTAEQVAAAALTPDDPQADWPAHLRDDAPSQKCGMCGRSTWDTAEFGRVCGMTQGPNDQCMGFFMPAVGGAS